MRSFEGYKKQQLRRAALERRESLCPARVRFWGELIQDRVLHHPRYRSSEAIALYSPTGNEVPTQRIRDHALAEGRKVFYPKIGSETTRLAMIGAEKDLVPGRYGILEPQGTTHPGEDCGSLMVFVPAVLVDKEGNRIGRGGGWYDRTLAMLDGTAIRMALVYEFQLIEEVPVENWDLPVDFIITEERVLQCGAKR